MEQVLSLFKNKYMKTFITYISLFPLFSRLFPSFVNTKAIFQMKKLNQQVEDNTFIGIQK